MDQPAIINTGAAVCPSCHLVQCVPPDAKGRRWRCARCDARLRVAGDQAWRMPLASAAALAALILYPLAVTLPVMRLAQWGHVHETGILRGGWTLLTRGHAPLGVIVLLCSVAIPLLKIVAILLLAWRGRTFSVRHRRMTHDIVELTSRWGMLDVLLVAVLVAAVKLGDLVDVTPGPGALTFAAVVLLGMVATAAFDRRALWAA
jgi:paraquat-inducible protein A